MFALERSSDSGPDPSFSRFSNMMNPFSVGLGSLQILAGMFSSFVAWKSCGGCDHRCYVSPLALLAASMGTY